MSHLQGQPAGRAPAPPPLDLVQAFVNTNDIEGRRDVLRTPEDLGAWLADHGLLRSRAPVREADFVHALELREALRRLAAANNGDATDSATLETLNRIGVLAPLAVEWAPDGRTRLRSEQRGAEGALAEILAIVHDAAQHGTWQRLKACRRDVCRWVFYDRSRNASSVWCSMALCGNRTKTRAYRRRRGGSSG